jgi:hypothetical protein
MGEIADAMLDGTFCQYCGEYLGSDNGYPTSCGCCADEDEDEDEDVPHYYKKRQQSKKRNRKCPLCDAWFASEQGIMNHLRVKHKAIKCEYCGEISQHWLELKAKSRNYIRKTFLFCDDCIPNIKYIITQLSENVKTSEIKEKTNEQR